MNTQNQQESAALAPVAGYVEYVPQWQEKLGWKLYPASHVDMPDVPNMHDCLVCRVTVHLSWIDRLRTLISGRMEVSTKTATENVIGKHVTASGVSVRPPTWLDRRNAQGETPRPEN
jgi:hypothetical protein